LVSNTDLNLTGVDGLNVNVGRYYNNLSQDQNAFGIGWSMGTGADTYLAIPSDPQDVVDYFDGTGDAQMFTDAPGSSTETAPPGVDAQLTMNDPGNAYGSSTFTLLFRHSGITETFTADADALDKVARLSTVSDRNGNTIHYDYNGLGQLTSIVDSYGNTTTIDWSTAGYIDQITDPTGRVYKYFQNSSGQLTSYEDPAGNSTDYSYDEYGNLTQIQTAQGNITNVAYDAGDSNEVTSVTRLVHPTDSSGPETTYQIATASGTCPANPGATQDTVSDPNRHTTTYCTDDLSRLTQVIDANGHSRSTSYTADGYVHTLTSALNTPTTFSYTGDDKDNVNGIQQGNTGGESGASGYSSPVSETLGYGGTTGTGDNQYLPTSVTDTQGNTTSYEYGTGTSGDYGAGEPKQITDALSSHNQATLTYNADGTVATSTDPDGNESTYGYTGHDLTSVTPPSGSRLNAIALTYDSANRVKTISTISGSSGHKVIYCYDAFDRITSATYKNAAGTTVATIGYQYDADGNLVELDDPSGSTDYDYDGLNRLTNENLADGTSSAYGYDAASNLTQLYDDSGTTTYVYNKANQLTSITDPSSSRAVATFTYDADGNPLATTYASGASVVNTYNDLDQLTKVTDTYKTSGGSAAHLTYSYAYTTGGLQHTVTDQANNQTTYTYDNLDRLTDATTEPSGGGGATADYNYTLDGDGNLDKEVVSGSAVTGSTTSYGYNSGNQICWSVAAAETDFSCDADPTGYNAYTYDADGNQTSNGNGLTATYNALNQTTSITSGSTTTDYSYLGEGQNQLTADGTTTLNNSLLGLIASGSTHYTRAITGQPVDERTSSATYNYLYDGDGNVIGLTDSSGHLVNQYAYDPYGNKTTNTGSAPNPFGYRAGYTTSSGLIHYGARYLNSVDARWTQEDPRDQITDLTQDDRYSYAGGDPTSLADLNGMDILDDVADAAEDAGKFLGKYVVPVYDAYDCAKDSYDEAEGDTSTEHTVETASSCAIFVADAVH